MRLIIIDKISRHIFTGELKFEGEYWNFPQEGKAFYPKSKVYEDDRQNISDDIVDINLNLKTELEIFDIDSGDIFKYDQPLVMKYINNLEEESCIFDKTFKQNEIFNNQIAKNKTTLKDLYLYYAKFNKENLFKRRHFQYINNLLK